MSTGVGGLGRVKTSLIFPTRTPNAKKSHMLEDQLLLFTFFAFPARSCAFHSFYSGTCGAVASPAVTCCRRTWRLNCSVACREAIAMRCLTCPCVSPQCCALSSVDKVALLREQEAEL